MSFADANGNGLTDAVFVVGDRVAFFDSQTSLEIPRGARPGLLIGLDNGLGASTDIAYVSTASLANDKATKDNAWDLPQVLHVVKEIRTRSGLAGDDDHVASYDYNNPVFDFRERRFRGFRNVVTKDENGVREERTYFIGDGKFEYNGSLLVASEVSDGFGHYHSASLRSYRVEDVATDASTLSPVAALLVGRLPDAA